jgi:hypothetical protein
MLLTAALQLAYRIDGGAKSAVHMQCPCAMSGLGLQASREVLLKAVSDGGLASCQKRNFCCMLDNALSIMSCCCCCCCRGNRHAGKASSIRLHLAAANTSSTPSCAAAHPTTLQLELTDTHFVLTQGTSPAAAPLHKRASDVAVGDVMWAAAPAAMHPAAGQQLAAFTVCSTERVTLEGLYNPYTLSGTILVNGVAASSHSYWFADAAFDALGLPAAWPVPGCAGACAAAVLGHGTSGIHRAI